MTHRISCLLGAGALAALLSLPAAAQEYSNGGNGEAGRGPAILTPVEAFGVHPPGLDPADAQSHCASSKQFYVPYYAPLSPVASSARWKPWSYHPLYPYYTPYYPGYSPHRHFNPPPRPYGSNGWGKGPLPEAPLPDEPGTTPLNFGAYTSVVADDTTYWNMGGNGLVPYGAPRPITAGPPDLIDAIQSSRPHRRGHVHFIREIHPGEHAIAPPAETTGERESGDDFGPDRSSRRRAKPPEPIPAGDASQESGDGLRPDGASRPHTNSPRPSPPTEVPD